MSDKRSHSNSASTWKLVYDHFEPAKEGLREALCTLGNGYFATRGALNESRASRIHYPGTYIAGLYNILPTRIAGRTIYNEDLVNCPNWLLLYFCIGKGEWIDPVTAKIISFYQELDMKQGVLYRHIRFETHKHYITTVESWRIVHMADRHCAAIRYVITPENYTDTITLRSALDGTVQNTGVARYRQLNSKHLRVHTMGHFGMNGIYLSMKTSQSHIEIAQAAKLHISKGSKELHPRLHARIAEKKMIVHECIMPVKQGRSYTIEKNVALYTSHDKKTDKPLRSAIEHVTNMHRFDSLYKTHEKAWANLWKRFDIEIEGDSFAQRVIRLHTFHLLQTASLHNVELDVGLPARGLHGEAYRGHIFWDELYVMPFYDLRAAEISRSLLLYRYRRLPQARAYARAGSYKGAMFPWQSGSTGREETQVVHLNPMSGKWGPDHSCIQRHVSFDIAYNFWHFWLRTGDLTFMQRYGVETIVSIAQFAASLCFFDKKDDRYHTDGVMGPDEFHEKLPWSQKPGFRDNAYTNVLVVWLLSIVPEALALLSERQRQKLMKKIGLAPAELKDWEEITKKMNLIVNEEGIISQFDGYFQLKELDWAAYRKKYTKIQRMDRILKSEGKSPNDYKVAKQADTLMMFYLFSLAEIKEILYQLGYRFTRSILKKNYEYYLERTSHGSTLSKVVHCYLAHLLGKTDEAWKWYVSILQSDIYDTQGGTTPEGIHAGVMGACVVIALRAFAGVRLFEGHMEIHPSLPKQWRSLRLKFRFRKNLIAFQLRRDQITLRIAGPRKNDFFLPVKIFGEIHHLRRGKTYKFDLKRTIKLRAPEAVSSMAQERILIVDDDVVLAENLKTRLEAADYLVDCAHTGNDALDVLKSRWVDLVISNVLIHEGIDGYQLFKQLKRRRAYASIPVIIQSDKSGMKEMFETLGAHKFLVKPYNIDDLLSVVQEILKK